MKLKDLHILSTCYLVHISSFEMFNYGSTAHLSCQILGSFLMGKIDGLELYTKSYSVLSSFFLAGRVSFSF